jgi:hypothetical protein
LKELKTFESLRKEFEKNKKKKTPSQTPPSLLSLLSFLAAALPAGLFSAAGPPLHPAQLYLPLLLTARPTYTFFPSSSPHSLSRPMAFSFNLAAQRPACGPTSSSPPFLFLPVAAS